MNWTPQQMNHYQKLSAACASCSIRDAAAYCFEDCKCCPPASPDALASAETALGCALPADLLEIYRQTDGLHAHYGANLIMPIREAVQENERLRQGSNFRQFYMPFDHMLVFGGAGNGDLFFFRIHIDGSLANDVFIWDHESDSRSYFANNLKDLFLRFATNLTA